MKLFNKGWAGLLLAGALVLGASTADARQFGFKVDAGTVDDVTTTACTVSDNGTVRAFGNGVDMDQVWALQKEVGSKGSGAWETVQGFKDIFPTAQGAAAVGGPVQRINYTSNKPACFRLKMTTDAGGTAQVQVVTEGNSGTTSMTTSSHAKSHDDFFYGALCITTAACGSSAFPLEVNNEAGGANVIPVIEAGQEGLITMSSGSDKDAADISTFSYGLATHGSLVSSGLTVVEFRASMSQITATVVNFGLNDTIANDTEFEVFKCDTNVCAESTGAGSADAVMFLYDTDSADAQTDMWNSVSMNNSTLGNAADEYTSGFSPVASTFAVFRIEVDSAGHAYWYYNDTLVGAEPLAVATTAQLIPLFSTNSSTNGSGTANKIYVDYLTFWSPRTAT